MWHPESTRLTPLMHIMEQGSPIRCGGYGWGYGGKGIMILG